jgi:hypothetical protein
VHNVIEFYSKYGMLSGEHFRDYGEVELNEKSVADYLGF